MRHVQAAILLDERGGLGLLHLAQHLLQRFRRQVRVEPFEYFAEARGQHDLVVADALGRGTVRGDVRPPVQHGVTEPGKPFEGSVLDAALREFHCFIARRMSALLRFDLEKPRSDCTWIVVVLKVSKR